MILEPQILIGPRFVDGVIPAILGAELSIDIIIYDWRMYIGQTRHPVMRLTDALVQAVDRGVEVRAIVSHDAVRGLLEQRGIKTRRLFSERLVHAKMLLIDSHIAVVGSHNYTQNAMTRNLEISLCLDLGPKGAELQSYFNNLWGL